jgi:hypothetical protein
MSGVEDKWGSGGGWGRVWGEEMCEKCCHDDGGWGEKHNLTCLCPFRRASEAALM